MKKVKYIPLLLLLTIPCLNGFTQKLQTPEWIKGTWQNSFESNMNHFIYWTFYTDSITQQTGGINSPVENLNSTFAGYQVTTASNDSIFRIRFIKDTDDVCYEFKYHSYNGSDIPQHFITISTIKNGNVTGNHDPFASVIFFKQ
ncbi:hypothetical protein [Saccharicrinis sp. FJH54]|uniref:hypothetical protein n=1 Tax=Saccharicrinis sp. FJH54 TaxID=3344665 RepID=UPI0035D3F1A3